MTCSFRQLHNRQAQRRYWRRRNAQFQAQNLTSRGTPKKYTVNRPELAHLHGPRRKRQLQRIYRQQLKDRGLTVRGTPPQRTPSIPWQVFREIHRALRPTPDFETILDR